MRKNKQQDIELKYLCTLRLAKYVAKHGLVHFFLIISSDGSIMVASDMPIQNSCKVTYNIKHTIAAPITQTIKADKSHVPVVSPAPFKIEIQLYKHNCLKADICMDGFVKKQSTNFWLTSSGKLLVYNSQDLPMN